MENDIGFALMIWFFYFLINHKWSLVNKIFVKDSIPFKLFHCIFCFSFWASVALYLLDFLYVTDILIIPVLALMLEMSFQKLK